MLMTRTGRFSWCRPGAVLLVVFVVTCWAKAFPRPAIVSDAWHLEFTHSIPKTISVVGADGQARWYWYITYKVQNDTGEDQLFVPEVTVATDSGLILAAGKDVPAGVFGAVKQQLEQPLLESSAKVIGRILQGPDHAKEGVAIWPAPDEDVDRFTIFVAGLSGETRKIEHPVTGEPVLLRKTLMLEYNVPGTPASLQDQTVIEVGSGWVMR